MQRILIVLVVGLLAVGCGKTEQEQKALRDSVLGEYEGKDEDGDTRKWVFLLDSSQPTDINGGIVVFYRKPYPINPRPIGGTKWSIVDEQIQTEEVLGGVYIYRINADKSITRIAKRYNNGAIDDVRYPKEQQRTYKKIK